ncbi:uncharacterized protein [Haliotis asinina]|uniref:uncharacterized protein n=1 Tax=Haliotis asinina TaxID=109174 RepID=UPI003531B5FE
MGVVPLVILLVIAGQVEVIRCHGYMFEPPARSSMWRQNITGAVVNNNDNGLFCGGFGVLWSVNNGRCGVCGDRWDSLPRDNEAGGKFAKGIIGRHYTAGSSVTVKINLTANHKGYFEFRLCENNDVTRAASHECFDQHILKMADGRTRYDLTTGTGVKVVQVSLPVGVRCQQCILQWKYNTGNFWGCDAAGCGLGRGRQEQYYNCADIAIQ